MKFITLMTLKPFRALLLSLAAITLGISASGQVTYRGNVSSIKGEAISPQLKGIVLQVLFDGVADLYYRSEDGTGYYYITDKGGRLFTISVPEKARSGGKASQETWRPGITTVLKVVMQDAPALYGRIESVSPDRYDLTELMREYHDATAKPDDFIIYEAPPPALVPYAGFFVAFNTYFLKPGSSDELDGFAVDPAFYPSAGITLKAFLPRISKNFSLALDVSFGKRYFYGYYSADNMPSQMTDLYQELHMHNNLLMTNLIAAYSFGQGRIRPVASGGICTRAVLSDNSRIEMDAVDGSTVISDRYDYLTKEKYSFGVILSPGLSIDLQDKLSLTTSLSYSELFITDAPGSYRSVSLKLGLNL